ncbi:MAG: tRNA dihydrouridine synthase DusB [Chromatiales bacterium]|jgi:tRNA-dihydrouridine synthase B|nr:tRNA dihydrouridine synthase DusB [Chromatiales bacterium]
MRIGPYVIDPPVVLAPMAGVTDKPFRQLCRRLGAGLAVSEMTSADPRLRHTRKSCLRRDHAGEPAPVSVQIAGYDAGMMAEAARANVAEGAQLIDINMGCPAKKVCNVAAGSALLRDEVLVGRILDAVVAAAGVPVTLKIRTGYTRADRNALRIARLAEAAGIAALAIHGRTREDFYTGEAEYETIAAVKAAVRLPVIANGDIATPRQAAAVLAHTGADAVMIGRAAHGRPWLFRGIAHFLATGRELPAPAPAEVRDILVAHLSALHDFYGEEQGVRIARKHLGWYTQAHPGSEAFRAAVNTATTSAAQLAHVHDWFDRLAAGESLAA